MIKKNLNGILFFSFNFADKYLLMAMSTRKIGNLNVGKMPFDNAKKLLNLLGIEIKQFVAMEQIHGNKIGKVSRNEGGSLIPGVDGLVTTNNNLFLGAKTADCIPLFFYDSEKKIIGIVHAGWKGTLKMISERMIETMSNLGALKENIFVLIGPHIGKCCYEINKERVIMFKNIFKDYNIVDKKFNKYYLDLGLANKYTLIKYGIKKSHIELIQECTSCNNEKYFSYRKDSKETFGEMLSIIGVMQNE